MVVVAAWAIVQLVVKVVLPYCDYWEAATEKHRAGVLAMTDPTSMCSIDNEHAKLQLRTRLKGHFVNCEEAELAASMWPWWTAFGRLADDFNFCPRGTCMQFHFTTLDGLGIVFLLLLASFALILLIIIASFCFNAYKSVAGKHDLPYGSYPLVCPQQTTYPPTGAYNFNAPIARRDDKEQ